MLKHETLTRQMDIIPMEILDTPITVIGAGAIGSHATKALAQMGFHTIRVFDEDTVEAENLNSQGYALTHLKKPKVEALAAIVTEYTGINIEPMRARYERGIFPGIVISAVDNMLTRRVIWEEHAGKSPQTLAIIDPRMAAEYALLYTMNPMCPKDLKTYPKTLYNDDDALREACTGKATIYTALLLSGLVCKAVKDVLTRHTENFPRIVTWSIRDNEFEVVKPRAPKEEERPAAA